MKNKYINVLGMMTGTSLDGIDISIIKTNGIDLVRLDKNYFYKYKQKTRDFLLNIIQHNKDFTIINRVLLDHIVTYEHYKAIKDLEILKDCDLIGFHGQTIFHNPETKTSVQLGNAEKLSKLLKKKVVFDFRSKDMERGGEGAPLAPIYHKLIIESLNLELPSCILNIGGVSNITYWDGQNLIGFDTGPGNALMNDYVKKISNEYFDKDGYIASKGKVNNLIVKEFLKNSFFNKAPPKSLDRNTFKCEYQQLLKQNFSKYDIMATLAEFTIQSIICAFKFLPKKVNNIIISGGGHKNKYLMYNLNKRLSMNFVNQKDLSINLDYVESELIAYLSARSLYKLPFTFPSTTGVSLPCSGGKLFRHL